MNTASKLNVQEIALLVEEVLESETIICFNGDIITKLLMGDAQCTVILELSDQTAMQSAHLSVCIRIIINAADDTADFSHCDEEELEKCLYLLGKDLTFAQLRSYESEDYLVVEFFRLVTVPFQSAALQDQLEVVSTDLRAMVAEWQDICTPIQLILCGDFTSQAEVAKYIEATEHDLLN